MSWPSLSSSSPSGSIVCDYLFNLNFSQLISEPTCIHGSLLDLIITSSPESILDITFDKSISLSDHYVIFFDLKIKGQHYPKSQALSFFNYSKADYECMSDFLFSALDPLPSLSDPNVLWNFIRTKITEAREIHVPQCKIPSYPSPKYFTPNIRHALKCIHTKRRLLKIRHSPSQAACLHSMESELQHMILSAQSSFIQSLVSSFNSKPQSLFTYLRQLKSPAKFP